MGVYAAMIVSILFALVMAYVASIHFRRGNLSPGTFAFWLAVWAVFIAVAATAPFWPRILAHIPIAARLFDVVVAGLIVVLAVNSFRNAVLLSRLERKLTMLVEDLALKDSVRRNDLPEEGSSDAGRDTR